MQKPWTFNFKGTPAEAQTAALKLGILNREYDALWDLIQSATLCIPPATEVEIESSATVTERFIVKMQCTYNSKIDGIPFKPFDMTGSPEAVKTAIGNWNFPSYFRHVGREAADEAGLMEVPEMTLTMTLEAGEGDTAMGTCDWNCPYLTKS